jgi:hypothetical protein
LQVLTLIPSNLILGVCEKNVKREMTFSSENQNSPEYAVKHNNKGSYVFGMVSGYDDLDPDRARPGAPGGDPGDPAWATSFSRQFSKSRKIDGS